MQHSSKRVKASLLVLVLLLLLLVAAQAQRSSPVELSAATDDSKQVLYSELLSYGYFDYREIVSYADNSNVSYTTSSNVSISTAFMNLSQFTAFNNNPNDLISNSMIYQNATYSQEDLEVGPGQYFLVFYAYLANANVSYFYKIQPVTPYSFGPVSVPEPSGIASFGVYNDSSASGSYVTQYEIRTNEIVGIANITALDAQTLNASLYGDNVAGVTLQLNANVLVTDNSGQQYTYWAQNVQDFVTSVPVVSVGDSLWNNTDLVGYLDNQSVTSSNFENGGFVSAANESGTIAYDYQYNSYNASYSLPYDSALLMNESVNPGVGVLLQMGISVLGNGSSAVPAQTYWYDNITIHDPDVNSAYFEVSGNDTTPLGSYYDAEFVFAGEGNGESANFIQASALLGLFYQNDTSSSLISFPSYYSFGGDTGEAADNLDVAYSNGIAQVGVGSPNYVYLGNASLALNPDLNVRGGSNFNFSTTTTASTVSTSTVSSTTTSKNNSTSALIVVAIIAVIVIVLIVAITASRRHRDLQLPQQVFSPSSSFPANPRFCSYCGAAVLHQDAVFCGNCGKHLESSGN